MICIEIAAGGLYKFVRRFKFQINDHMTFSWWGYKAPTQDDLNASESEGWWGDEIPYVPAE